MEYKLGRKVEQIVETPGSIKRLNVSVVLPRSASDEQIIKARDLVEKAVGFLPERGDAVSIQAMSEIIAPPQELDGMSVPLEEELKEHSSLASEGGSEFRNFIKNIKAYWYLVVIIFGLTLLLLVILFLSKRSSSAFNSDSSGLSESERKEALDKLNRWLGESAPAREQG